MFMLFGGKLYVAPNIFQGNMNSHLIPCYDILYILIQVHVVGVKAKGFLMLLNREAS